MRCSPFFYHRCGCPTAEALHEASPSGRNLTEVEREEVRLFPLSPCTWSWAERLARYNTGMCVGVCAWRIPLRTNAFAP